LSVRANFVTAPNSDSTVEIYPLYYDRDAGMDYDSTHDKVGIEHSGGYFGPDIFPRTYGNDNTIFKVSFLGIRSGGTTETVRLKARYLLWANPTSLATGQKKYMEGL